MFFTSPGSSLSALLKTTTLAFFERPSSSSMFCTEAMWASNLGLEASTRCRSTSASSSSSSVALKADMRSLGRSLMNPTVSVITTSRSRGNLSLREAVSSVANIFSSTNVSLLVSEFRSVDLPALV